MLILVQYFNVKCSFPDEDFSQFKLVFSQPISIYVRITIIERAILFLQRGS